MTDPSAENVASHHLLRLYDHLAWANQQVLSGLEALAPVPPRALELFNHVLAAENVWLSRILGEPPQVAVWPQLELAECARLAAANQQGFASLLEPAKADDLAREVAYQNSAGQAFRSRISDILLHVVLHGMYHRGQIAIILRDAGLTPTPIDYIAFVRGVPAATRQPGQKQPG